MTTSPPDPVTPTGEGVICIAIGDLGYLVQACLAAASVRRHAPGVPVRLCTDAPAHPLTQAGLFDEVVALEPTDAARYPLRFAAPLLDRVRCLAQSPFERTVHLDVDARLARPGLERLFEVLDDADIALAECAVDASLDRRQYRRPLFNNGVIAYRCNEAVRRLLARFADGFEAQLEASTREPVPPVPGAPHIEDPAERRRLLCSDQIALAQLLSPECNVERVRYAILPEHWNWRGANPERRAARPPLIDHHPRHRERGLVDLAGLATRLLADGDGRAASPLYLTAIEVADPGLIRAGAGALLERLSPHGEAFEIAGRLAGSGRAPENLESLLRIAAFHAGPLGDAAGAVRLLQIAAARHGVGTDDARLPDNEEHST